MAKKPKLLTGTPKQHGWRFPAEWERQSGTWFSWPRPEGISFPDKYHTVPGNLAAIVREIAARQTVHINVPNGNYERIVAEQLIAGGVRKAQLGKRVRFHRILTNESWCRDHGPAFLVRDRRGRRELSIVDWGFNAWGGKYPPWDADDAVPTRIAEAMATGDATIPGKLTGLWLPRVDDRPVVMEGGAVEFDGRGTVLTTRSCLLNKNRNPHLTKAQIEQALCDWYGQERVLWLGDGIVGDDTDGHVDDLARFLDERTICVAAEDDPRDANHEILTDNLRAVRKLRDADGRPYEIVEIPMPGAVEHDGMRLPATYVNFLFVNGALLVPTFGNRKRDQAALATLQRFYGKRREVVGIDCRELIWGLGAIHCLSQQQPASD
ncbi:MAG: putative agmatine deiminase [Planctomycetota bacterium]|jgi:agmatine deiminase